LPLAEDSKKEYVSALGVSSLIRFYDILCSIFMPEKRFRSALLKRLCLSANNRVLDIGCGTGTQLLMLKKHYPDIKACGIDGDIRILHIARAKADKAPLEVSISNAMSFQLPYFDNSFDRVVSTLMFHHLTSDNKHLTAREAFRVLRPQGVLLVAVFGKPHNSLMHFCSNIISRFDQNKENVEGQLVQIFQRSGFASVEVRQNFQTIFGTLALYRGVKPSSLQTGGNE
jgi:ubiquinone/menaquinone biosynthesis C-methylase UbiE